MTGPPPNPNPQTERCPDCEGTGKIDLGMLPCPTCRGTGKKVCPTCGSRDPAKIGYEGDSPIPTCPDPFHTPTPETRCSCETDTTWGQRPIERVDPRCPVHGTPQTGEGQ